MNNTINNLTTNGNTTKGSITNVTSSGIKNMEAMVHIAQFYGKISTIGIFIFTFILVFVSYYISQKRKEATYYGVEDKLDQEFFARNPKYVKQREEMEICHVKSDSKPNIKKNGNNNFEGSIKILQKKHPTSVVMNSNMNIDGIPDSPEKEGRVVLSNRNIETKIDAIIELDNIKRGREILEIVQRKISDKVEKIFSKKKQSCYVSKVCGMIAMETRHSLEQLSDDLWVVYGSKDDNTFVTSGLHNIFESANSMSLSLRIVFIQPAKCKILAFKIDRKVS
uniref:Inner membrane protein n=1 Tax=Strongyloides papillosus TaxID=174720 RepID=A0A0N5C084_STREA